MEEVGPAVVCGIGTTFLGILPLAFANSEIFRVFFRLFLNIISYAAVHGLAVLPVLLLLLPIPPIPPVPPPRLVAE